MYAKDKQNNIDIIRIVSEIKSKYRGDARTRTPTNYNLSEQTKFVIENCIIMVLSGQDIPSQSGPAALPRGIFNKPSIYNNIWWGCIMYSCYDTYYYLYYLLYYYVVTNNYNLF